MTEMYAERRDQMFPKLTQAQIARISGVGERRKVRSGEVLFELGEQNTRFFVVIEGAIEIVRPVDGREERITVLGPGEFTGEINMLSARRNLVRARALGDVPVIVCETGQVLRNPTIETLATGLGLSREIDASATRDVIIVGAGPAGLAAAVYAASEGLDVLVLENSAPGGQAGSSSRIENYLGFPTGVSGLELAGRALTQAEKFGAEVAIARGAVGLDCTAKPYTVRLATGEAVRTRTVVIASGARYRKPTLAELSRFEGAGVMYSATHVEAQLCKGEEIAIVGGGNSAGQAAVFLSQSSAEVHMLVRGPGLADSMSRYLIQRIEDCSNVVLRARTQVDALEGTGGLERVRWRELDTGRSQTRPIRHLFLMTGADPNTSWLKGCVALDDKNFVKTGADLNPAELEEARWPLARRPDLLETSRPGVFAVGDVRSGSVKRVASAVGEGSVCVQLIHRALREL